MSEPKLISFRVSASIYKWLEEEAEAKGESSPSKLVQQWVKDLAEKNGATLSPELSTESVNTVNKIVNESVQPLREELAALKAGLKAELKEELLGEFAA
jgi:hypothetical protein